MTNLYMADSISDEKLTEAFPPSNISFESKIKILHNLRARIICEDNSLQGLLTFVPSSVVPDKHPMFEQVAYTNGDEMFFADKFFSMETPVQCAVILHEMFHIVFRHCSRGKKRIGSLFNIAADAIINESIGFQGEGSIESASYCYLIKKDVVNLDSLYEEFDIPSSEKKHFSGWTTEDLYEYLVKKLKQKLEQQVKDQEKENKKNKKEEKEGKKSKSNSSQSGSTSIPGSNRGGSKQSKSNDSESELEKLEREVEELANKLAKKHKTISGSDIQEGSEGGKDPANAQIDDFIWTQRFNRAKAQSNNSRKSILGKVNPDVYSPQIPWHVELRKYLVKRCMPLTELSYQKPARRMASLKHNRVFLPGLQHQKGLDKMVVIIDTSGSCFNEEELTMFCTEIQSIQEQTNVEIALIFADTEVRSESIVKADGTSLLDKIKMGWIRPAGGGGTDMVAPFVYALKKYRSILTVIASDGYTPFPTKEQIKNTNLLWVINTQAEVPKGSGKALYIHQK